ncbi:MAG: DsrE family protein [Thermodesulfovibrionales bacterium]|nr:DsrE family protein [Thermodesulfovibrionales bacterium]
MAKKTLGFIIKSLPYKDEASRLALTHAISSQSVDIYLEDGDSIEPVVCFIGHGVLNCLKNQEAMKYYADTSIQMHLENAMLVDLNILICREDLDKFGLSENDIVLDAEKYGADTKAKIVPYSEIQKVMDEVDHLQFF